MRRGAAGSADGMRGEGAGGTRVRPGARAELCVPLLRRLPPRDSRELAAARRGWESGDQGSSPARGAAGAAPILLNRRGRDAIQISPLAAEGGGAAGEWRIGVEAEERTPCGSLD